MQQPSDRLVLPHENADQWEKISSFLSKAKVEALSDVDALINHFSTTQVCKFFSSVPFAEEQAKKLDWKAFLTVGVPFLVNLALECPVLFADTKVPLLLEPGASVTLSRRQAACLLCHSFFGSITQEARQVRKEKWSFRVAQLFFLEAIPSAMCVLNYFLRCAIEGFGEGSLTYARRGFARGKPTPWTWEQNPARLVPVTFETGSIESSLASTHIDFANRFVGGGCLENDFYMGV